jgi:hypothetical protein
MLHVLALSLEISADPTVGETREPSRRSAETHFEHGAPHNSFE